MQRRIFYADHRGRRLACQVLGDERAERDIVFVPSFVSHLDLMVANPPSRAWLEGLTRYARVITFDKAGTGLSDPVESLPTLEDRAEEIEAVMDAADSRSAVLFGLSEGGPMAILFAATRPERADALVLFGALATGGTTDATVADLWLEGAVSEERFADAAKRAFRTQLGEAYTIDDEQADRLARFAFAIRDRWGHGEALGELVPSYGTPAQLGLLERSSASPAMALMAALAGSRFNIRHVLPALRLPVLVVHARDDLIPFQNGRFLADHIPGARLLEVSGRDHAPWLAEPDRISAELERHLTGERVSAAGDRTLRAVLFADLVASTRQAATLGDVRWRAVIERFEETARQHVEAHRGTFVKSTGDGFLATFEGPDRALRCAEDVRATTGGLGLELRVGAHVGEVEMIGDDVAGMTVNIAARVCDLARPREILVSGTVRDLVVGSGRGFADRGVHELEGVPGRWALLALDAEPHPLEVRLSTTSLPSPRQDMPVRDRLINAIARRAPRVLRAIAPRPR